MFSEIVELIRKEINVSDEEARIIGNCIQIKTFRKGTILLKEGQVSKESYQNLSGLVRKYYVIEGNEVTTDFYEEGSSIASFTSLHYETPSKHYFECIEDCKLAVLNKYKELELIEKVPGYETLCRTSVEKDLGKQQDSLATYLMSSPEQRYIKLLNEKPKLLNRVPLYLLASYIGVQPESLSRIRRRVVKNKLD